MDGGYWWTSFDARSDSNWRIHKRILTNYFRDSEFGFIFSDNIIIYLSLWFVYMYTPFCKLLILIFVALTSKWESSDFIQSMTQKILLLYFFWIIYKAVAVLFNDFTPICLKSVLEFKLRITKSELLWYGFIYYALLFYFIQFTESSIYYLYLSLASLIVLSKLIVFVANTIAFLISGEDFFKHNGRRF